MLALISPAKKLNFEDEWNSNGFTQPDFLDHSQELVNTIKGMPASDLQSLMALSDKLGELNYNRYQQFSIPFTQVNARTAITAFRGDTYVGLDADTLLPDDISYAENHLRILSGLYGLLRPSDLVQAYRLEMKTRLRTDRGDNLYDFWGGILSQACNNTVKNHSDKTIVSLASNEYIKAIKTVGLESDLLTCHFKELKDGEPKTIGLFAKRGRGMMARFMIQRRLETPEQLKDFNEDGYAFESSLSDELNYVFLRKNS
jgi:cytoplasmic iron level regulating protein YaaA (DUF328/UPF0246 family)